MSRDYSNFSLDEIDLMPFWKRLCFETLPWNHSFDPQNVQEWATRYEVFGISSEVVRVIQIAVRLEGSCLD